MKIRKTYQGVVPNGKVLNSKSDSQIDTYSCDYLNKQNNYSTEEVIIGTFMGKPLYRKVIISTPVITSSNYSTFNITHNINNLKNVVSHCGELHNSTYTQNYTLPTTTGAGKTTGIASIDTANITLFATNESWNGWECVITLEYTKTTD